MSNPSDTKHLSQLRLVDSRLRLSVIPLSVASIWLTVTDRQVNNDYGKLEFSNLTGVNFISAIYALVAAISSWIKCFVSRAWIFFVSDQLVGYLMVTSTAAMVQILYLSHNGDQEVTRSETCSSFGKFCCKLKLALVFHGLALCFFLVLAVTSAFKAFSRYEPPDSEKPTEEGTGSVTIMKA